MMSETVTQTEVLLTAKDLREALSSVRGRPVPPRTLQYWRSQLGISPNPCGLYEQSDLESLIGLVHALARGWNSFQYVDLLRAMQTQCVGNDSQ